MMVRPIYWVVLAAALIVLVLKFAGGLGTSLLLRFVMMREPADLVFVSGAGCDIAMEKIAGASPADRERYFRDLVALMDWPAQDFVNRARKTSAIEEFFAGFTDADGAALPKEVQAYNCFRRQLGVFRERAPDVIKAVIARYKSFSSAQMDARMDWHGTLRDLCERNDACADAFPEMIESLSSIQDRTVLVGMLVNGGAKAVDAILAFLGKLPGLGFDRTDSDEMTHATVEQLIRHISMWAEREDMPVRARVKAYILDSTKPAQLRWRLASGFLLLQNPEISAAVLEIQKSPAFPPSLKPLLQSTISFHQWRSMPEILMAYIEEGEALLKQSPKLGTDNLAKFEDYAQRLHRFQRSGTTETLPASFVEPKKRLAVVINEILRRAMDALGPNSNLLNTTVQGLRNLEPIDHPMAVGSEWLKNSETQPAGVDLSLMESPLTKATQGKILSTIRRATPEVRSTIFQRLSFHSRGRVGSGDDLIEGILVPLISSLTAKERPTLVQLLHSRRDHAVLSLTQLLKDKDLGPRESKNVHAVLFQLSPTVGTKDALAALIVEDFKCDIEDISLALGSMVPPESAQDVDVYARLLGCPEAAISNESLASPLFDPKFMERAEKAKGKFTVGQQARFKAAVKVTKDPSRGFRGPWGTDDPGSDGE